MSTDLESLSNKELRSKCMEYGLPNVPVTASSRKLLIRRLAAAMLTDSKSDNSMTMNSPSSKGGGRNQRRETMHVSKPSEQMAPPPPSSSSSSSSLQTTKPFIHSESKNSVSHPPESVGKAIGNARSTRRTIAATERHVMTTTTVSEPESSDTSPERYPEKAPQQSNLYAQSRSIPQLKEASKAGTLTSTPNEKKLYPLLPRKEPSPKPIQLNKTDVVTTSYVLENPVHQVEEEVEAYNVRDHARANDSLTENDGNAQKNTSIINLDDYEDGLNSLSPLPLQNPVKRSNVAISDFTSTDVGRSSLGSGLSIRDRTSSKFDTKRFNTTAIAKSRSSYSAAISKPLSGNRNQYNYEDDTENAHLDHDKENAGLLEDIRPPYLSEFARKLEHLKASPIACKPSSNSSLAGNDIYPIRSANRSSSFYSYGGSTAPSISSLRNRDILSDMRSQKFSDYTNAATTSNSMIASRGSVSPIKGKSSFQQCLVALDQKYHLKQILFLITLFVIGVFVYVFFIQTI